MTQRWKLTIEYDGAGFSGWQRQTDQFTVQQCIEEAITRFSGETVRIHAAGRTDAGVHAVGQVAHMDLMKPSDEHTVRNALNYHMRPHPVAITQAEPVSDDFHARFSATKRVYCYKLITGRRADMVIGGKYVWSMGWELDVEAMRQGAQYLLGTHDFSTFRDSECQAKNPVRTMNRLEIIEVEQDLRYGRHLEIWAEAPSFLHHQVRNIVGTLFAVGQGKWQPEDVKTALEARDRTKGGITAPAAGLFFVRVEY